jgi:hypothetical protein
VIVRCARASDGGTSSPVPEPAPRRPAGEGRASKTREPANVDRDGVQADGGDSTATDAWLRQDK